METTRYFTALRNGLGCGGTRVDPAITAGSSWDAAGLKRAREESRARARGRGGMGGAAAVFRGGREARRGEARLRGGRARGPGTWGSLVSGVWALGASRHSGPGSGVVAGDEED